MVFKKLRKKTFFPQRTMSGLSKTMECPICLEVRDKNVIICKSGHGACEDCAATLRGSRCHTCRGALLRSFLPNHPFNGTVPAFQEMEQELRDTHKELQKERTARNETEIEFAQYKSQHEGLMQDIEAQLPGNKRRRSEVGESSTAMLAAPSRDGMIGRSIQISGLVRSAAYNGKKGIVQGPHGDTGKLVVRLEEGKLVAMSHDAIERCIEVLE